MTFASFFVKYYYFNIRHMHEVTTITGVVARKNLFPVDPLTNGWFVKIKWGRVGKKYIATHDIMR